MSGKEGDSWEAKFELGEVPALDPRFDAEAHIRILFEEVKELKSRVKTLDTVVSILVCLVILEFVGWLLSILY
ncbi:MAG: hypothetical protein ACFFD2_00445 [Promethearchaeota archaeon]